MGEEWWLFSLDWSIRGLKGRRYVTQGTLGRFGSTRETCRKRTRGVPWGAAGPSCLGRHFTSFPTARMRAQTSCSSHPVCLAPALSNMSIDPRTFLRSVGHVTTSSMRLSLFPKFSTQSATRIIQIPSPTSPACHAQTVILLFRPLPSYTPSPRHSTNPQLTLPIYILRASTAAASSSPPSSPISWSPSPALDDSAGAEDSSCAVSAPASVKELCACTMMTRTQAQRKEREKWKAYSCFGVFHFF